MKLNRDEVLNRIEFLLLTDSRKKTKTKLRRMRTDLKNNRNVSKKSRAFLIDRYSYRQRILKPEETYAYEIVAQTSVNTHEEGKYDTEFSYSASGYFDAEPSPHAVEKMVKNSMIAAFNSGAAKGRYLQKNLFGELVDGGIRGVEIRKKKVRKSQVKNMISLELEIKRDGRTWKGKN